jgi:DNA-binding beta-propeller fold protein YncE
MIGKLFWWLLLLLLILVILWWLCCAPDKPEEPDPDPGPSCELFTSNARNSDASVLSFDTGGMGAAILGLADGLGSPRGLAIDPVSGDLFIADAFVQKVFRWSSGSGLAVFADAADGIGNPQGLAFSASGELYVSNARNADASVLKFDAGGTGVTILGLADGLASPRELAIDPVSGDLFIADAAAEKVFRWNAMAGLAVFADSADGIGHPEGLAFEAGGDLFVSNARNADASVLRFDPAGTGVAILGLADGLGSPRGMAVEADSGDLLIADAAAQRVLRRSSGGGLSVVADAGDGVGNPEDVAPDCGDGNGGGPVTPGTIYGLAYDNAAAMETVVTVDPATGAVTPVGAGVADCCTLGGFPVSALDPAAGVIYAAGNLMSDPGGSARRLLGFSVLTGGLVSSPFLPAGYQYNRIQIDSATGTLYVLAFDQAAMLERMLTIDPVSGALTPVGGLVADCCTVGGFDVSALDPASGRFYVAGNRLSEPAGSPRRLLGFDTASGALVSQPALGSGYQYNRINLEHPTGTLFGLVFDQAAALERVVTIDPATAAVTPVGAPVADCCTVGGFHVSALDAAGSRFYIAGNRLSDPGGSARRLLGFDTVTGTLATNPPLPAGYNYNRFELAVVAAPSPAVALSASP